MAFDSSTARLDMGTAQFDPKTAQLEPERKRPFIPSLDNMLGLPTGEAILNMASGAVAKPLSDIAGLATIPLHAAGIVNTDPEQVQSAVRGGLTYEPRTEGGKYAAENNALALLGKGINWLGDKAANAIAPPQSSGPAQTALGQGVGEAIRQVPMFAGAAASPVTNAAAGAMRGGAESLMQSALKPTLAAQRSGAAESAVNTMLDQGLNVSKGGVATLRDRINYLNDKIAEVINSSSATIDKGAVAGRLQDLVDRYTRQVNPQADVATVENAYNQFLQHPSLAGSQTMPIQTAQQMKQGTYRALGDKAYGELKGADIEAQKTLARGLKEEIASAAPEVRPLNAEESKLITALNVTERRVLMDANKNPAGLGLLTHHPAQFAAFIADRSPLFKSLVARMLNGTSQGTQALSSSSVAPGLLGSTTLLGESKRIPDYIPMGLLGIQGSSQ